MKCYLSATVIPIVSPSTFNVNSLGTDFVPELSPFPLYHFRQTPSALEPHPPKIRNSWQKKISTSLHRKTTILLAERKQLSSINSSSHQKHRHGSLGPSQISHLNPAPWITALQKRFAFASCSLMWALRLQQQQLHQYHWLCTETRLAFPSA